MNTSTAQTQPRSLTISLTLQIIAASIIAIVVLYGVGFAEMDVAHNSAHDSRHSVAFPCH